MRFGMCTSPVLLHSLLVGSFFLYSNYNYYAKLLEDPLVDTTSKFQS